MRFLQILQLCVMIFCVSGCYAGITGKVIDAETQRPIEGAVVLVEWTKTYGYGLTGTKSVKVAEVLSDKEGKVELPSIADPFVNPPDVTVYKQGYVAWNSRFIFPTGYAKRTDFEWKDEYVFKLEVFRSQYTHNDHVMFLDNCIGTGLTKEKKNILKAIKWEEEIALKERQTNKSN